MAVSGMFTRVGTFVEPAPFLLRVFTIIVERRGPACAACSPLRNTVARLLFLRDQCELEPERLHGQNAIYNMQ